MTVTATAQTAVDSILTAIPVTGISIGGLVMLIVTAFMKEWIYPRGYVTALREDRDRRIAEITTGYETRIAEITEANKKHIDDLVKDRDQRIGEYQAEVSDWREAYRGMEMALAAVRAQNGELLELARTSEHVLRSLPVVPTRPPGGIDE